MNYHILLNGRWEKIEEIHPGADEKVRVVTMKTKNGYIKRPIVKLCPLSTVIASKQKSPKKTKGNILMYLLTLCLLVTCDAQLIKGGSVAKLSSETFLYMDKIGTLNRVSSSWEIVLYYDMEPYFKTISHLDDLVTQCEAICVQLKTFED